MDVFPDFGSVGGASDLRTVVGALLMFVLIIAVLMLIVSAIVWAIASSTGNHHTATKPALRTFGGGHGVSPPAARSMRSR